MKVQQRWIVFGLTDPSVDAHPMLGPASEVERRRVLGDFACYVGMSLYLLPSSRTFGVLFQMSLTDDFSGSRSRVSAIFGIAV
eukprot:5221167-Amphidinium_carterae.1